MNSFYSNLALIKEATKDLKEDKIIVRLLDVIEQMGEEITSLKEKQEELQEYIDLIDNDLGNLEEGIYSDEDEDEFEEEDGEWINEDFKELICPSCNNSIFVDSHIINNKKEISCPICGNMVNTK